MVNIGVVITAGSVMVVGSGLAYLAFGLARSGLHDIQSSVLSARGDTYLDSDGDMEEFEALPHTEYTNKTIAFIEKADRRNRLLTEDESLPIQIAKCQPNTIYIGLRNITLEEIPERIAPGIKLRVLDVSGARMHESGLGKKTMVLQLFSALEDIWIETLRVAGFEAEGETWAPARQPSIHLCITKELTISWISPSFLVWFCESVDLSSHAGGISLELCECSIDSIACLDGLGIKNLSGLCLSKLPHLQRLDYHMPGGCEQRNTLAIQNLPLGLEVPSGVAQSITEGAWKKVFIHMCTWNRVYGLSGRAIVVKELLSLNVGCLDELSIGDVVGSGGSVKTLEIRDGSSEKMLAKAFFDSAIQWAVSNAKEVETLDVRGSYGASPDLDLEALLARTPIELPALSRLERLWVCGRHAHIRCNPIRHGQVVQ
ncbi:hypothetical protein NEDG_01468 [Nematocida displodere]|uniref:Uncharacterized protein n=1 Tax=Nematocida displodere TaxID=1805483 RepID=A0A177EEL9_9MICR|nr:hypothetical protein NEDG_01468 [Nematocida displodere]